MRQLKKRERRREERAMRYAGAGRARVQGRDRMEEALNEGGGAQGRARDPSSALPSASGRKSEAEGGNAESARVCAEYVQERKKEGSEKGRERDEAEGESSQTLTHRNRSLSLSLSHTLSLSRPGFTAVAASVPLRRRTLRQWQRPPRRGRRGARRCSTGPCRGRRRPRGSGPPATLQVV